MPFLNGIFPNRFLVGTAYRTLSEIEVEVGRGTKLVLCGIFAKVDKGARIDSSLNIRIS